MIRPCSPADHAGIRAIYGEDDFARPELQRRHPRLREYLADSMSHYYELEPESTFVAAMDEQVVGALLGAVDTRRCEKVYEPRTRALLRKRTLAGAYGWPAWWWANFLTERAGRKVNYPKINLDPFPAHLHIGLLPQWRRKGIGTRLMQAFEEYLRAREIPGYHLYAASFHPLGVAFYRKSGLDVLGRFHWRFHTGYQWLDVEETVFGKYLRNQ
ncbi:MAG: GNAT family N-acetyltransferase [Chloroflexota bacterium]